MSNNIITRVLNLQGVYNMEYGVLPDTVCFRTEDYAEVLTLLSYPQATKIFNMRIVNIHANKTKVWNKTDTGAIHKQMINDILNEEEVK